MPTFKPFTPFRYSSPPWPTLYLLYVIPKLLFLQLPLHTLLFLLPSQRPRRSWSVFESLKIYGAGVFCDALMDIGVQWMTANPQVPPADTDKHGWVPVPPAAEGKISREVRALAEKNKVPVEYRSSGCWFGVRGEDGKRGQRAKEGEKVLLYFHGGGYIMGTSYGFPASPLAARLLKLDARYDRCFCPEYRLASSAPFAVQNAWPAALIDAVSSYLYLLQLGFKPEDVVITGDSAGGHLAFALGWFIARHPELELGRPGGLLLLSPTMDFTVSSRGPESSFARNQATDAAVPVFTSQYTVDSLRGSVTPEEWSADPLASPGSTNAHPPKGFFAGLSRTLIHGCDAELALDSIRLFAERLEADVGKEMVEYVESVDMTHDGFLGAEGKKLDMLVQQFGSWMKGC